MNKRSKLILAVVLCGVMAAASLAVVSIHRAGSVIPGYAGVKTEADRLSFIRSFGWETGGSDPGRPVTIPAEFDDSYTLYNKMQIEQGLDLRRVAGREVILYTYPITNHPSGEENVTVHLLIYKNKVVGGDVMSPKLDGFMHGFAFPEKTW